MNTGISKIYVCLFIVYDFGGRQAVN